MLLKDTVKAGYYNDMQQPVVTYYKYDSLNRIIKKTGLNENREKVKIEAINYIDEYNYSTHEIFFPKRDFTQKITIKYDDKGNILSKNFHNAISPYYQYSYYKNGLPKGYKYFYSSPVEDPIKKIDSIKYEFDYKGNWISRTEYDGIEIAIKLNRSIKYR